MNDLADLTVDELARLGIYSDEETAKRVEPWAIVKYGEDEWNAALDRETDAITRRREQS